MPSGAACARLLPAGHVACLVRMSARECGQRFHTKEQVLANEQQDQKPHDEGRESDQQTLPGKSGNQTISGQGNENSGGQGKQKQNQNPQDQAKPGMQQRDPSSPGTKDDEQDDDNLDHQDDSGSPGGNRQTSAGKSGGRSSEGRM